MKQFLTLLRYRKEIWAMLWLSLRHVNYEDLSNDEKRVLSIKSHDELWEVSRASQKHLEWWETLTTEDKTSLCLFFFGCKVEAGYLESVFSNNDIKYIYDTRQKVALGANLH